MARVPVRRKKTSRKRSSDSKGERRVRLIREAGVADSGADVKLDRLVKDVGGSGGVVVLSSKIVDLLYSEGYGYCFICDVRDILKGFSYLEYDTSYNVGRLENIGGVFWLQSSISKYKKKIYFAKIGGMKKIRKKEGAINLVFESQDNEYFAFRKSNL